MSAFVKESGVPELRAKNEKEEDPVAYEGPFRDFLKKDEAVQLVKDLGFIDPMAMFGTQTVFSLFYEPHKPRKRVEHIYKSVQANKEEQVTTAEFVKSHL